MKKALIMNNILSGGGVEKVLHDVAFGLIRQNYKVTILTIYKDEKFDELYAGKVQYYWLMERENNQSAGRFSKIRFKVKNLFYILKLNLRFFNLAVAIKEGQSMRFLSRIVTCRNKVGWVHIDFEGMHWTQSVFKNAKQELCCMRKYKNIICVSNKVRESVCSVLGNPGNLIVRYNPIDTNDILMKSKEPVTDFVKKEDRILLMSIGRLQYQKGYDLLIDAVEQLKDYENQFEIVILGQGEELQKYLQLVKSKEIHNITFLGNKENPYKYLRLCDWFLSTSRYEGYSLVSQEAAVLDRPIIATNCSGVPELLGEKSEYGMVIDCSVDAIREGIHKILEHRQLQKYYEEKISQRKKIVTYDERLEAIMEVLVH